MVKAYFLKCVHCNVSLCVCVAVMASAVRAQTQPPWTPIEGSEHNMIAYGVVYSAGSPLTSPGYSMGTYGPGGSGTDCRSRGLIAADGSYYATIRGDADGETIHFMVWNGNSSQAYLSSDSLIFQNDTLQANFDVHFTTTGVTGETIVLSIAPRLYHYPNPVISQAAIYYQVSIAGPVSLILYNITGQPVKILVNTKQPAGSYRIQLTIKNFPNGVYLYCLNTKGYTKAGKMIIVR